MSCSLVEHEHHHNYLFSSMKRKSVGAAPPGVGPSSIEGVRAWPEQLWTDLRASGGAALARLRVWLDLGILAATDFSGLDAPRWAVQQALEAYGEPFQHVPIVFLRSSDIGALQRSLLERVSRDCYHGVDCVLGGIEERLALEVRRLLDAMEPSANRSVSSFLVVPLFLGRRRCSR